MIFKITTSIIVLLFLLTFDTCLLYFSVSQPLYKADYNIFNKNQTIYTSKQSYLFHTDFISLSNDIPISTEFSDANVYSAVNYYYKKNSSVQKILNYSYKFTVSALVSKVIPLFLLIAYMNHVGKRYLNNDFNRIKSEQDIETPENEDDLEIIKKQLQQKQFNAYMNNLKYNNNNNDFNNNINQFQYKFNYQQQQPQQQQQILINVNSNNNKIEKNNNTKDNKKDNNNNNINDDSNNIKKYKVNRANSSWIAFLLLLFNFLPFLFISIAIFYPLRLTHAIKNEEFVRSLCVNNSTNEYHGLCKTFAGFSFTDLPDNTRSEYIWRPTLSWYSLVVSIIIEAATVCITIKSLIMDSRNDSFKKVFLNFILNKKQQKQQKNDNQDDHHNVNNVNIQNNINQNNNNIINNNSSSNSENNNNSIINNSGSNMTTSNNSQNSLITPESTPNLTSQQTSSSVQSNIEIKS